uniref:Uncharacterized protein n=1 Tax=Timema cristinae TaxID=61476 RepID=A0A7R9GT96_TIMCR|nr:unnamed protein product [Timema cristinae]
MKFQVIVQTIDKFEEVSSDGSSVRLSDNHKLFVKGKGDVMIRKLLNVEIAGLDNVTKQHERSTTSTPCPTLSFPIVTNTDAKPEVLIGQESTPKPHPPLKDHTRKPQPNNDT